MAKTSNQSQASQKKARKPASPSTRAAKAYLVKTGKMPVKKTKKKSKSNSRPLNLPARPVLIILGIMLFLFAILVGVCFAPKSENSTTSSAPTTSASTASAPVAPAPMATTVASPAPALPSAPAVVTAPGVFPPPSSGTVLSSGWWKILSAELPDGRVTSSGTLSEPVNIQMDVTKDGVNYVRILWQASTEADFVRAKDAFMKAVFTGMYEFHLENLEGLQFVNEQKDSQGISYQTWKGDISRIWQSLRFLKGVKFNYPRK